MKSTETKAELPVEKPKAKPVDPRPWMLIDDDTPRDGMLLEVKADPDDENEPIKMVQWRITRRRNHATRRWDVVSFWADPLTHAEIDVEPLVWRLPEGFR